MTNPTWKEVKDIYKSSGSAFKKIPWTEAFDKIASVLKVKNDKLLLTELYKLRTKYNKIKGQDSADRVMI